MGRRRKKESSRKRCLVFEESPVESRQSPMSPVHCVHNPVTAASVPVGSDTEVTWVSPQFHGLTVSHGKRRQARRQPLLHSGGRQLGGAVTEKENTLLGRSRAECRRKRKFPTLCFVGDMSQAGSRSMCQRSDEVAVSESKCEGETKPAWRQPSSFTESAGCSDGPLLRLVTSNCSQDNQCPHVLPNDCTLSGRQEVCQEASPHPTHFLSVTGTSAEDRTKRRRRKSNTSDMLLSPLETTNMCERSPSDFPEVTRQLPVLALFDPSPTAGVLSLPCCGNSGSQDSSFTEHVGVDLSTPTTDCRTFVTGGVSLASRAKKVKVTGQAGKLLVMLPRRSKRLQVKYADAVKYLQPRTPAGIREDWGANVLVQDTPESEYGLSLRQRQQRKMTW